jgi:hypothetical protein
MLFGCRDTDDTVAEEQQEAVDEAAEVDESLEQIISAQIEHEQIDDDRNEPEAAASSTLDEDPEMATVSRRMNQSMEKFNEMRAWPIPASFNGQQRDTTLQLVSIDA